MRELFRSAQSHNSIAYSCTSLSLCRSETVETLLGVRPFFFSRILRPKCNLVFGWGLKWSGRRAMDASQKHKIQLQLLEDGFLRSVRRDDNALSLVFDNSGIFYDATMSSEFEHLVRQEVADAERLRTRDLTELWRSERLSKYNSEFDGSACVQNPYILVCDQTFGDASISHGLANTESFARMLKAALAEYPNHTIILKTHPDVVTRSKKGHFHPSDFSMSDRIKVISAPSHPSKLIEKADAIYVVTSQMGFEALLWGKHVRCFGMPFYAGWGLTEDELPAPDRREPVSLEQLVHAALVKYPRYIDPVAMLPCEPEVTFRHVGLQRRKRQEFPEQITAIGFSRWKRPFVQAFLQGSKVTFLKALDNNPHEIASSTVAIWGSSKLPDTAENKTVLRIEDGFLRSSGLGADLVRPLSLVIDNTGIYYDATRPSGLESILQNQTLDALSTERAIALRERLIQLDLTKYNLGKQSWSRPETDQVVLLVVGQVETDASIRLGSPDVKSNMELLRRVREEQPSAYIIYKPHPDVVAGLRKRGQGEDASHKIADEMLTQPVALGNLIAQVDEVHTMTSLLGFEALIRGAKVVCHGLPFYAGWGLTTDRLSCSRRTRRLTLAELVHGALIDYPRYYNFERHCFVEPEQAVDQLAALAHNGPQSRSWERKVLRLAVISWLRMTGSKR